MIAPQPLVAQATALADIVFHGLPGFVQEAALRRSRTKQRRSARSRSTGVAVKHLPLGSVKVARPSPECPRLALSFSATSETQV